MPDLIDGRQLMARAQAGDIDAFGELYSRYRNKVLAYAWRRHPDRAEEIMQDTFVKALANLHQWSDSGRDPIAWLTVIAANLCRDRAKSKDYQLTEPVGGELPDRPESESSDPGALAIQDLTRSEVLRALLKLTEPQREVVVLFHLLGMSLVEVAKRTGSNANAVKSLLHRARRELAPMLAGVR